METPRYRNMIPLSCKVHPSYNYCNMLVVWEEVANNRLKDRVSVFENRKKKLTKIGRSSP